MPPPQPPPKVCRKKKDSCSKTLYLEVFAPLLTVGDQWVTQPMERVVKRLQNTAVNPRLKRQHREWTDSTILQSTLETTTQRVNRLHNTAIHAWNNNTESEQTPQYCNPGLKQQHGEWRIQNTAVNPHLKQHREGKDSTIPQSIHPLNNNIEGGEETPQYSSQDNSQY